MRVHEHHESAERNPWRTKKNAVVRKRNNKKTKITTAFMCKKNAAAIIVKKGINITSVARVPSTSVPALIIKSNIASPKLETIFFLHAVSECLSAENIEMRFSIIPHAAYFMKKEIAIYIINSKTKASKVIIGDCIKRKK